MYSRCVVLPALASGELTPSPVHANIVATMVNLGRYAHLPQYIWHRRLHTMNLHHVDFGPPHRLYHPRRRTASRNRGRRRPTIGGADEYLRHGWY